MARLIVILLIIFIVLTFLRSFIKRYRAYSGTLKKDPKAPVPPGKKDNDENIVDAKFEEIK